MIIRPAGCQQPLRRYPDNMQNLDASALRGGPFRKRNLFSHVVEELGSRIVRGDFNPGAALPNEADLGLEYGASRSVVREAVKSLAAKGLLESRTRTGIRVLTPIHWNLLDPEVLGWRYSSMPPTEFFRELFEFRGMIEPQAAGLAAERATDAEIAEMQAAYAAMEATDQPGNPAIQADLRFHRAVLAGAHNDLLLQMGNLIGVGLTVSYRLSSESYAVFLPLHRDVLEAIAARDVAEAQESMRHLLSETQAYLDTRLSAPAAKRRAAKDNVKIRRPAQV
jgi:GntR family galactonate operon transcriptional repressor